MRISLQSHSFTISSPYSEGHQLTAGEAQALNALRAENIRNSLAKKLAGRQLTGEVLAELFAWLAEYDKTYQFKIRAPTVADSDSGSKWDVGREALLIARQRVEERWRAEERPMGDSPDVFGAEVAAESTLPEIVAEAIQKIEAKKEVARRALEELLGGEK